MADLVSGGRGTENKMMPFDPSHTKTVVQTVIAKVPPTELRFAEDGTPLFTRKGWDLFCAALDEASVAHPHLKEFIEEMRREFAAELDGAEGRN